MDSKIFPSSETLWIVEQVITTTPMELFTLIWDMSKNEELDFDITSTLLLDMATALPAFQNSPV